MINMSVNIYGSRRNYYNECRFWYRSKVGKTFDSEKLMHDIKPDGEFYAKEEPIFMDTREIGDTYQHANNSVHIKTMDDLGNIKKNDLVEFNGTIWIIDYVQKQIIEKTNQFSIEPSTIITLYLRS